MQVIAAGFFGIVIGIILDEQAEYLKPLGTIFINLIKMVIVPLIIFSLISGINAVGSNSRASSIAVHSIVAFFISAFISVVIGIVTAVILKPGLNTTIPRITTEVAHDPHTSHNILSVIESFVSENAIQSMCEGNIIQVIIFTVLIGLAMSSMREKCANVIKLSHEMSAVIFKLIEGIVKLAPIGVFGYLAWSVGTQGMDVLLSLVKLIGAIIVGCLIQYILYGVYLKVFAGLNPGPFYKKMFEPQVLAFSTSSSKATLTTIMRVMHDKLGVSKNSINFVLPIGTSINMNGGAIYLTVASIFFAQSLGKELQFIDYFVLGVTCTIGSIGAAGIPSGILLFLGMALKAIGLPTEYVALIAGIDRILDMFTTMINVLGDAVITTIIDKRQNCLDTDKYYSINKE